MAENSIRIVSYNVENLFKTEDTIKHWTHKKYWNKVEKISRVIANIGYKQIPAIVGLQEVENDSCMIDLCRKMRKFHYKYIHYDSPDKRGIDVGMLYDSTQYKVLESEPLHVPLNNQSTTRDILYVKGILLATQDTLHIMICHLPSMLGGRAQSQWKRDSALNVIKHQLYKLDYDNVVHKKVNIIIMGDFNDSNTKIQGMYNAIKITNKNNNNYTHKYQGRWAQLDYFWISESLIKKASAHVFNASWLQEKDSKYLDIRPKRTYNGWKYNKEGYSDHLPIYLDLTFD